MIRDGTENLTIISTEKKTWQAPEDTIFARISLLVSLSEGGRLVALILSDCIKKLLQMQELKV